jgi:hypothetical protein
MKKMQGGDPVTGRMKMMPRKMAAWQASLRKEAKMHPSKETEKQMTEHV